MSDETPGFGIEPLIQFIEEKATAKVLMLAGPDGPVQVLMGPTGHAVTSLKNVLDAHRTRPERRKGTAEFQDLLGLIEHANRFKEPNSVLFAWRGDNLSKPAPTLTSVLDYHPGETPNADARFGQHRGFYKFPLSEPWGFWNTRNGSGNPLSQAEFAEFIEDRVLDIAPPPTEPNVRLAEMLDKLGNPPVVGPSTMLDVSRNLTIHAESTAGAVVNLASGEGQIQWSEVHKDASGAPVKVPKVFLIAIPVFHNGPAYLIPVRLRYRMSGGKVSFWYEMFRPDLSFEHAFDEACQQAARDTGMPLFLGKPEASP